MGLHDIDKQTGGRVAPQPNTNDDVQQRMAQGTSGVQNTSDLDEVDGLQFRERQIIAVQDGENKAAFGFYGSANKFGLKVAEDGVDVLTAANDELIFNSEFNTFKIVSTGVITLAKGASTISGTATIQHDLGYVPLALLFWYDTAANFAIPHVAFSTSGATAGLCIRSISYEVDSNYLYIYVTAPNWAGNTSYTDTFSAPVRYYLLQETISTN